MVLSFSGLLHNLSGVFTKVPSYGKYCGFLTPSDQTPGNCVHRETRTNMEMALDNLSSAQKDELMSQVKQQIALANAQELLTVGFGVRGRFDLMFLLKLWFDSFQKMTEKCFKKCISKPGTELDSSEQVIICRVFFFKLNLLQLHFVDFANNNLLNCYKNQ